MQQIGKRTAELHAALASRDDDPNFAPEEISGDDRSRWVEHLQQHTVQVLHDLLQRLPHGLASEDMARIPMHLMARHSLNAAQLPDAGNTGLLQDWAQELRTQLEHKVAGSVFRRTRTRFDQARLDTLVAGKGFVKVSAPGHLWRAWRAAVMQPR
jgi:hypothetical protein